MKISWVFLGAVLCAPLSVLAQSAPESAPAWTLLEAIPAEIPLSQQAVAPWQEYDKQIKASGELAALGPDLFGDAVNLQTGALSFSATDASSPGNSRLPVAFTRVFSVRSRLGDTVNDLPLADWDIDLPRISGTYGPTWLNERCSTGAPGAELAAQAAPTITLGGVPFTAADYWTGLTANMPGGGELLAADQGAAKPPVAAGDPPYLWLTPSFTYFSCLPTIQNGPGQGFKAVTADGVVYWFDWMAQNQLSPLASPIAYTGPAPVVSLNRKLNALYVTRVRDRFGNEVNYTYTNNYQSRIRLETITSSQEIAGVASSQRRITLSYRPSGLVGNVRLEDSAGAPRTWTYGYANESTPKPNLISVIQPDGRAWGINFQTFTNAIVEEDPTPESRRCTWAPPLTGPPYTGTMTHPSGAVGSFTVTGTHHRRANVPYICFGWTSVGNDPSRNISALTHYFSQLSLTRKQISGVSMDTLGWNYSYISDGRLSDGRPASTSPFVLGTPNCKANPGLCVPCTSASCAGFGAVTTVQGPGSGAAAEWKRFTFGNSHRYNEGKLLRVESGSSASNLLQTVTTDYEWATSGRSYPTPIGRSGQARGDGFVSEQLRPEKTLSTLQDGATFTWSAQAYNQWAVPTEVTRSSSLGYSKRERFSIRDYTAIWTLNQFINRQDVDPSTQALTNEEVHFRHGPTALVARVTRFLIGDYVRWYAPQGTLQTAVLPNGSNVSLMSYYRGIPRQITHSADNSQISAVVDDFGRIGSVTDPLNNLTGYSYDPMGRQTQVRFPSDIGNNWNTQDTQYTVRTSAEYGISAGLWKRAQTRGRMEHLTYFDALWRPVLTVERDTTRPTEARFVRKAYDLRGNLSFESYPGYLTSTAQSYLGLSEGTSRQFDALNRATSETRSSELGNLTTTRAYLSGFRTQDRDARGNFTTTSYMAYDQPSFDWPMRVDAPEY